MIARLNELDNNYNDKGRTRMWARTGCGIDTSLDELDIGEYVSYKVMELGRKSEGDVEGHLESIDRKALPRISGYGTSSSSQAAIVGLVLALINGEAEDCPFHYSFEFACT